MARVAGYEPQPQPHGSIALHQYACLRCRSRRVKCDKILSGCANCASHGQPCVYSARRPRKPQKANREDAAPRALLPAGVSPVNHPSINADSLDTDAGLDYASRASGQSDEDDEDEQEGILPHEFRNVAYQVKTCAHGGDRLLVNPNGDARFVDSEKVNQLKYFETVLVSHPQQEDAKPAKSKPQISTSLDATSLLNASHENRDLRLYHPPAEIMHLLWDFFLLNVDIMAKVLYKPAVGALIERASRDTSSLSNEEPLLFAIWLASVTTMTPEQCLKLHREERSILVRRYRYALDQSLTQNGWMTTQNIVMLQSLTLYLVFSSENSRTTWILSGIALSIAQAMGMHTDSTSYDLGPVETEIRRRVWWMLCQLDVRISENCGLQSHVPFINNTKLPLNINDSDLAIMPGNSALNPRDEFTDMTLSLIKIELAKTNLLVKRSTASPDERRQVVSDQLQRYENVWLKYFDQNSELHRLCTLGTKLIMARLWKLQYDNIPPSTGEKTDPEGIQEPLIYYNADVLDIAHQLPSKYRRHGWFFRCKYSQWHAVAYLLIQLCKFTEGPAVERAWAVVDAAFKDWEEAGITKNKSAKTGQETERSIWQPLLRLRERALEVRRDASCSPHSSGTADGGTPSTLMTEYEIISHNTSPEDVQKSNQLPEMLAQDALISGDPFFGNADDFSMEMNWEGLDQWAQGFRDGLQFQDDYQDMNMMALEWW
ncbi:hypothetical protein DM02DRAFT_616722 [Periconia macrospinosa]|uniref:Zn(2)-C6 fungal-type domain-containing protein n=1 Tax=Periconia macrospinosa TaxID=97972 RepID=A0A2V1DGF8_9PLEO|nr:hypothetical protein DM02DRAFT_616722 [Periconia macrospinosa]